MEDSMSRLSAIADGNLVGQTVELINGNDVILDGTYVKADGRQLDKATYPELYAMRGDTVDDLSSYTITQSTTSSTSSTYGSFGASPLSMPLTVTLDGKFITVGVRHLSRSTIGVSSSDDGESWTVPSYSIPDSDTFVVIRAFSTGVFIVTNVGVYRSVDYGKTFYLVYAMSSLQDIAFDGVSTYVVTVSSASGTIYYGDILTGVMTNGNHGGDSAAASVVWTGTSFIVCFKSSTTVRKSTNDSTWSACTALNNAYLSTSSYGNRLYHVNGVLVVFTSTKLFNYSIDNGLSWTSSADNNSGDSAQTIAYSEGLYYILDGLNIRKYTSLNLASTVYTMPALNVVNSASVTFNGTKFLYEVKNTGGNGYIHVGDSAPTGNISSGKILGHIFSVHTTFGGGNTLITAVNSFNNITVWLGVYKYNNGLFVPVKYSPTQYHFATVTSPTGLYHYAKDAKLLYYTKLNAATGATLYRMELDLTTGVFGSEVLAGSIGTWSNYTYVFRHTNGIYLHNATNPLSFFGTSMYTNSTLNTSTSVFVSSDGMDILLGAQVTPFSSYYSSNGGKSFVNFTAACYASGDGSITATSTTSILYKLGDKFYSAYGSLEGDTPFKLSYKAGVPAISSTLLMQVTDDIIISNNTGKIERIGNDIVATSSLTSDVSTASIIKEDGSIIVNGNYMKFYTSNIVDSTKFKISKLSPSTAGKAVYIKAK